MKKKMPAVALIVLISLVLCAAAYAETAASGKCGDHLTWTLDDQGILTIEGTGRMWEHPYPDWNDYKRLFRHVIIRPGVTSIGEYAFGPANDTDYCVNLASIELPPSVTDVDLAAFSHCTSLTSLDLSHVTHLGDSVCSNCTALTEVRLHPGLTAIPPRFFFDCSHLKSIDLRAVTSIGMLAFCQCEALTHVNLNPDLHVIPTSCFQGCHSLTAIDLSHVTRIGEKAFMNCGKLAAADLSSADHIGQYAFVNCAALSEIRLNPALSTLPERCFQGCSSLTSIDLSHVTHMGTFALGSCTSLTQVKLSPALTAIPAYCFDDCYALTSIDLSHITDIGEHAFSHCKALTEILLADGVALGAFAFSDTASLKHVRFLGQAAPAQTIAFRNSNADCLFYYPDDTGWTYEQQFAISGRAQNSQTGMAEGWIPYARADYTVRVLDAYTGKPIPNARITGPLIPAHITDADGCVTLRLWEEQLTDLVLSASGYEDVEIGSRLKKNASVEIRLRHPLPDLPTTGDASTPLLWCALGAAGVLGTLLLRRRGAGARRG